MTELLQRLRDELVRRDYAASTTGGRRAFYEALTRAERRGTARRARFQLARR